MCFFKHSICAFFCNHYAKFALQCGIADLLKILVSRLDISNCIGFHDLALTSNIAIPPARHVSRPPRTRHTQPSASEVAMPFPLTRWPQANVSHFVAFRSAKGHSLPVLSRSERRLSQPHVRSLLSVPNPPSKRFSAHLLCSFLMIAPSPLLPPWPSIYRSACDV